MGSAKATAPDRRLTGLWITLATIGGLSVTALGIASILTATGGYGVDAWPAWFRDWGHASVAVVTTLVVPIVVGEWVSSRWAARSGQEHDLIAWAGSTLATAYLLTSVLAGVFGPDLGAAKTRASAAPAAATLVAVERSARQPSTRPSGSTTQAASAARPLVTDARLANESRRVM